MRQDVPRTRFSYPVFLDLQDVPVLVVGGGPVGARKAAGLADAGAVVTMVATRIGDVVDRSTLGRVVERSFAESDLDGVRLVVTATGDVETDRTISAAATARGIWTNAADQPVDCEFILPAIARAGRISVAVSSDGASPAIAQFVRDRITRMLTDELAALADTLAGERAAVRAAGGSTEDHDWRSRIEAVLGPA